jgi:hypothetical protein
VLNEKHCPGWGSALLISGLTDELFSAAGATDADLALVTGDADTLLAVGAMEIAVIPILEPGPQIQPLLVLHLSQGNVLGEDPIHCEAGYTGIQEAEQTVEEVAPQEHIQQIVQQAQDQHGKDQNEIQLVGAVTAIHKASKHTYHHLFVNSDICISLYQKVEKIQVLYKNIHDLFTFSVKMSGGYWSFRQSFSFSPYHIVYGIDICYNRKKIKLGKCNL